MSMENENQIIYTPFAYLLFIYFKRLSLKNTTIFKEWG